MSFTREAQASANHRVQATPGCAHLFILSHHAGAPDPRRSVKR